MAAVPLILARGEERSAVVVIVCIHNCRTISIGEGTSAAPLVGLAVCTIFLYVPSSRWDYDGAARVLDTLPDYMEITSRVCLEQNFATRRANYRPRNLSETGKVHFINIYAFSLKALFIFNGLIEDETFFMRGCSKSAIYFLSSFIVAFFLA